MKTVVFDLDGTLIDSLEVWDKVEASWVSKRGLPEWPEMQEALSVSGFLECAGLCIKHFDLDPATDTPESVSKEWVDMAKLWYSDASQIPLRHGAVRLLRALSERGVKLGIATSNWRELAEIALRTHGIGAFFGALVTSDEVEHSKPEPDVYVSAARLLEETDFVDFSRVTVFEDSMCAAIGAKSVGMKVVATFDPHRGGREAWPKFSSMADWTVKESFDELDVEKLMQ